MANTKIPIELSSTPSIVDNGDAAAITIDSSEKSTFSGDVEVGTTAPKINLKNTDTSIVADQSLGVIEVESSDGSTGSAGTIAKLDIAASGTFDGSGHGSDFRFITGATNQSGSISLSEKLRIQTTGGISFNGDTAAANALDDYEEGTYTPVMNSSNLTYSTQLGWYIKVGSHVTVGLYIDINTNGNGSGVAIGDLSLPFAAAMGAGQYATCGSIWCNAWSTATKSDVGILLSGTSAVVTRKAAGQAGVATPTHGDLGGGNMLLTISYQTA